MYYQCLIYYKLLVIGSYTPAMATNLPYCISICSAKAKALVPDSSPYTIYPFVAGILLSHNVRIEHIHKKRQLYDQCLKTCVIRQ